MASNAAVSYWDFADTAVKKNPLMLKIATRGFDGDQMIAELETQPTIDFGTFAVNFNDDVWTVDPGDLLSPTTSKERRIAFEGDDQQDKSVWKLFFLVNLIWKTSKTHVIILNTKTARSMFCNCGGENARYSLIAYSDAQAHLNDIQQRTSPSHVYSCANALLSFLRFRQTFFKMPIDPELESVLTRMSKKSGQALWSMPKTPAIDDEYLEPLVDVSRNALHDDKETENNQISAAMILLASQVGMRISEIIAIETNSIDISRMPGKDDIAYMSFKTFKGARGDGGYRIARSILNPIALEAYLWLDEHCREHREELGIQTLVVLPTQKATYAHADTVREYIRGFILSHHDKIPCVNTQERFPEFQTYSVARVAKNGKVNLDEIKLDGTETFVCPKFHAFRATVATKLYEAGVDMRYIRKHMSHISEDTTAGYIRSDREIEKQNSDLVYKTVLGDGAKMLGPHGDEFMAKVNAYIETLPEQVKGDIDEVVQAASKAYPLRRKVGGVCIRCGKIVPCKRNDETDQIYCAFGVCPNQCCLYFMAADCLETVRSHIELVDANLERNHTKAARNELRKAQNVIRDCLVPELDSLDQQLGKLGREGVLERFPDLEELVDNIDDVRKETEQWLTRTI